MNQAIKKALAVSLALLLFLALMTPAQAAEGRKLRIVTTVFPQYDWIRNILGDRLEGVELTLLQDSGVDLHNFQPSAQDIMKVSSADLFVFIGGVSDHWVENTLAMAVNKEMVALNLMRELGDAVKEDTAIEGMQDGGHDHGEEHDHGHGEDYADDEHIWLSLRNAQALVRLISGSLGRLDPENAALYQENTAAYIEKLKALDAEYKKAADAASLKSLLFADRFPFRYLMDDYGIQYYAAFAGCSAETEASFETVTFLSGKVDELGLKNVLVLEGADKDLANTIVSNTQAKDQAVVVFDSMQSVDKAALQQGASYLGIMEKNLQAFKTALSQ